jgi:hypothetical protein
MLKGTAALHRELSMAALRVADLEPRFTAADAAHNASPDAFAFDAQLARDFDAALEQCRRVLAVVYPLYFPSHRATTTTTTGAADAWPRCDGCQQRCTHAWFQVITQPPQQQQQQRQYGAASSAQQESDYDIGGSGHRKLVTMCDACHARQERLEARAAVMFRNRPYTVAAGKLYVDGTEIVFTDDSYM